MSRVTPVRLSLTQLRKQAKEILKAHRAGEPGVGRVLRRLPRLAGASAEEILSAAVCLSDVQFALAREHGFDSWAAVKRYVEGQDPRPRAALKREGGAAWITDVPTLGWGLERDCTFIGALAAALATTDEPWSYPDLMGLSGLAFRIRWSPVFCPSCAVGEMPDEMRALREGTGWALQADVQFGQDDPDREGIRRKLVAAVDAGLGVLAYGTCLDMSLVYGYQDAGRTLWLTDYHAEGEMPCKLPLEKLGPMQIYLRRESGCPSPHEQLAHALDLAGRNWQRRDHDGGIPGRQYFYGPAAYDAWQAAILQAEKLSDEQLGQLHHTHRFAAVTLADARRAAARFLNNYAAFAPTEALGAVRSAIGHCAAEGKRLHRVVDREGLFRGPTQAWTSQTRRREAEVIEGMKCQDALLQGELRRALAAMAP
jgi:hypothetical protein